jgi:hypothetical protein
MTHINRLKTDPNYRTVLTPEAPATAIVGTSSQLIVSANNDRVGLILVNLSDKNNIYLGLNHPAVLNSGVTLLPFIAWRLDDFTFFVDEVYAIADVDSVVMSIQEFSQAF